MRIAICDDEMSIRVDLKAAIENFSLLPENAVVDDFSSGEKILESHTDSPYGIIFLDIEMGGISGLEVAQTIRATDRNTIIIFLTSHKQYVFSSFKTEPFDYIVKPVDAAKIHEVLRRAIGKYNELHYIIDFKWQDTPYALKVHDIVHVDSDLRYVEFITENNKYKCIGKLNEYERRLSPYGFLRCHQSHLINMNYIESIKSSSIITTQGYEISMSPSRKQECLKSFSEHITKYKV